MRRLKKCLFMSVVLILALVVACAPKATPTPTPTPTPKPTPTPTVESAADFYKKNTVEDVVATNPGGGTDYNARVEASFWSDITGGTMKVTNKPGAGQVAGANYVYNVGKPDGLTIAHVAAGNMLTAVRGKVPGVEFDLTKIQYIAFYGKGPVHALVVGPNSPYKSVADLQKVKGLKFGLPGETSGYAFGTAVAISLLNLDAKILAGYNGAAEVWLALARGEIDAMTISYSDYPELTTKKMLGPVLATVEYKSPDYWKGIPALGELVNLTPEQKTLLDMETKYKVQGQLVWARPEVSPDRVKFLRDAFTKILTNKDAVTLFLKDTGFWSDPLIGEDVQKMILGALALPTEQFEKLSKLIHELATK